MNKATNSSYTGVSRRSFFRLTMGAITLLPTVASAALLPTAATADEDGTAADGAAQLGADADVYVVSSRELALVVRDVSKPTHTPNTIPDAQIKITSRYNGASVSGTTDERGSVTFDITALSEDDGKAQKPAVYAFNAIIEVTAPGYRIFRTGIYRVVGGSALGVPTQPSQPGLPYPSCVSFDEWDVLYSVEEATDFVSATGNDIEHSFAMTLEDCPAGAAIAAELFVNGSRYASASATADANGTAELSLSETFLLPSSANALPVGEDNEYALRYAVGGTTYEVPLQLSVSEAPPEAQTNQLEKDLDLLPFNEDVMGLAITFPAGFPLIGGTKVKLWQPSFPVDFAYDPFGYIRVSARTPEWGYIRDNGKADPNAWKFHPRKSAMEQYEKAKKDMANALSNGFDALVSKDGRIKQIGFTSRFSFTITLELMAAATWEFGDAESRGRAQLALRIGANYSFSENFWAGPIPVLIRFSVGLNAKAAAEAGYISPSVWSFSKYRWDYSSTGFDLQICFSPTLSLGVGIGGVCSLSFKGLFALTFYLHTGPIPEGYEDKPDPRIRLGAMAALTLELEFLFFTNSWKIWDESWPDLYDNWNDPGKLTAPAAFVSEAAGLTLGAAFNDAKIITADSLAALAEFSTDGYAAVFAAAGSEPENVAGSTEVAGDAAGGAGDAAAGAAAGAGDAAAGAAAGAAGSAAGFAAGAAESAAVFADDAAASAVGSAGDAAAGAAGDAATDSAAGFALGSAESAGDAAAGFALGSAESAGDAAAGFALGSAESAGDAAANAASAVGSAAGAAGDAATDSAASVAGFSAESTGDATGSAANANLSAAADALAPEAEDAAQAILDAPAAPTYAPVGNHEYVAVPESVAPGVLRLGTEGSFVPATDIRIANNILSAARTKLFSLNNTDYIVRIAAVTVAGQVRTRVISEQVNGAGRRVLEFYTSSNRDECFDYDFDISTVKVNGVDTVNLVVISGTRDQGDATALATAASSTFFSFITTSDWEGTASFTGRTVAADTVDAIGLSRDEFPYRNYSCPHITQIIDGYGGQLEGQSVVAYLERAGLTPEDVMGEDPERTKVGVGILFFNDRYHDPIIADMDKVRAVVGQLADPTVTEMAFSERVSIYHTLMLKGSERYVDAETGEAKVREKTRYALVSTYACSSWDGSRYWPSISSVVVPDLGEYAELMPRLIPVPRLSCFYACIEGTLKKVTWERQGNMPYLAVSSLGTEGLNLTDFGVTPAGDILYWPAKREAASAIDYSDGGEAKVADNPEINLIMGARLRRGTMSKPFALCEIGHSASRIRGFADTSQSLRFLSSRTVELETGKGEQWYTVVPWVLCATLLSADPYAYTISKDDDLAFYVMIRNDGNCYIAGVTLSVAEKGGAEIGQIRLDFSESNTLESEWNPRGEDGALVGVEDDWALAPGATSLYWAESISIPEGWEGEKELEVSIVAVRSANVDKLGAGEGPAPEDVAMWYPSVGRAESLLSVKSSTLANGELGKYAAADITVVEGPGGDDGPSDDPSGGGSGGGQGGSGQGGSGSGGSNSGGSGSGGSNGNKQGGGSTPKSGDDAAGIAATAAGLALGGAAAAFAAYSLRRTQLEQEDE